MKQATMQHIFLILNTRPRHVKRLQGGMVGEVFRVELEDGRIIVAKVGDSGLDIEGYMLHHLRVHSGMPVPEVLHAEPHLLLMSYLEGDSHLDADSQYHAAELIAALHSVSAPKFGLERDTLIGGLHQPNTQRDSWLEFFREERLLYMARMAFDEEHFGKATMARIEALAAHLEDWLVEPPNPSLLHGDLWTTNILARDGKITGLIDPAIYYGHAEIELAFGTLFNTFGEGFFQRYHELRPIQHDFFAVRRDIYNLYPLLVHVRLFGASYVRSVDATLQRFGF